MDLWTDGKIKSTHTKLMHKKTLAEVLRVKCMKRYFNINVLLNFKKQAIVLIIFKNK